MLCYHPTLFSISLQIKSFSLTTFSTECVDVTETQNGYFHPKRRYVSQKMDVLTNQNIIQLS
jgi:hypothetical protein